MKRSNAPVFWLLFGAGGMLSALVGAMLVFITGLAVPLGFGLPADAMSYERVLAIAQHGLGKAAIFAVIALFAWHAAHRSHAYQRLTDVGWSHARTTSCVAVLIGTCSGLALVGLDRSQLVRGSVAAGVLAVVAFYISLPSLLAPTHDRS